MKFKINREFFAAGLSQVVNIVSSRPTLPVFSNVLIEAEDGKVRLTTTNLEIGILCLVKADVIIPGSITLPVKKLKDIVSGLMGSEISFELFSGTKVKITSGSSDALMTGIETEQFPPLPVVNNENLFEIEQSDLSTMIKSVSYAQSTDENRYVLNGVFFNFTEDGLVLVATDGRRLATCDRKITSGDGKISSFILPAKTVNELQKQLGSKGKVSIGLSERQVMFEIDIDEKAESGLCDKVKIVSKVVEGNYPQYKQVIPKDSGNRIEIERDMFLRSVEFAAKVTTDKNNSVHLNISQNNIEVAANGGENEASNKIAVQYGGSDMKIAFNPQFLSDPLKALAQDIVVFEFKDELSPGVLKTKDEGFLCVIMPQRK